MKTEQKPEMTKEELGEKWIGHDFHDGLNEKFLSDLHNVIRGELMKFGNVITGKKFPYAIIHGSNKPFATTKEDFSVEYVVDEFLNNNQ